MARRTVKITLLNNTSLPLNHVADSLCHGIWSDGLQPPSQVPPGTQATWQSESSGIATGTEGWVKYELSADPNTKCFNELVYIHWDNPFVYSSGTTPLDGFPPWCPTGDVTAACNDGAWTGGIDGTPVRADDCIHGMLLVNSTAPGISGIDWFSLVVFWPAILALLAFTQDIPWEHDICLRTKGSVKQCVLHTGIQSIRAVSTKNNQPSLRQLLHM
ncbi:MAG: hypothetical protein JWR32_2637 [Mycobacterium sp.]|jgi:hypothetical protein|nr:hypothetical protein [Mycobacterium sp.]